MKNLLSPASQELACDVLLLLYQPINWNILNPQLGTAVLGTSPYPTWANRRLGKSSICQDSPGFWLIMHQKVPFGWKGAPPRHLVFGFYKSPRIMMPDQTSQDAEEKVRFWDSLSTTVRFGPGALRQHLLRLYSACSPMLSSVWPKTKKQKGKGPANESSKDQGGFILHPEICLMHQRSDKLCAMLSAACTGQTP